MGREASDKLGGIGQIDDLPLDIGMVGTAHIDGPPVASSPIGGSFPVESITPDELSRFTNTSLKVRLNSDAVGYKYIVGGYQSRINYVSSYGINNNVEAEITGSTCSSAGIPDLDQKPDVYWYWGDINTTARTGVQTKNVPILTPIIDDPLYEGVDFIMIDMYDPFGDLVIDGLFRSGIYLASVLEIQFAISGYEYWSDFLERFRPDKLRLMLGVFPSIPVKMNIDFSPGNDPSDFLTEISRSASSAYGKTNSAPSRIPTLDLEKIHSELNSFKKRLWEGLKKIGDENYGKVFVVKAPAYSVKQDDNEESPLNSYVKSWNISQDAFLDPLAYRTFEAPDNTFVSNGRVKAYANYYLGGSPTHDVETSEPIYYTGHVVSPSKHTYLDPDYAPVLDIPAVISSTQSFKNFSKEETIINPISNGRYLVSVPLSLDEEYLCLPTIYFTLYDISLLGPTRTAMSALSPAIDTLTSMTIPYNGIGCLPFVKCSTKGVYSIAQYLPEFYSSQEDYDRDQNRSEQESKSLSDTQIYASSRNRAITPKSFGIPQQSTRYVYGPWTTNLSLPYGVKVEYVRDESLVPENYILPVSINIGSSTITSLSGYDGMNTIAQLMANTVENFDFLFTEEGTITIPEYPRITHIGQALVDGGPLVSDLSVQISAGGVSTTYNMTTFAPKFGRATKYVIDKLTSLAKRIKNVNQSR